MSTVESAVTKSYTSLEYLDINDLLVVEIFTNIFWLETVLTYKYFVMHCYDSIWKQLNTDSIYFFDKPFDKSTPNAVCAPGNLIKISYNSCQIWAPLTANRICSCGRLAITDKQNLPS